VGFYNDQVLPRVMDRVLAAGEFATIRARVTADLSGEVLEVGFGSGLNVPHYPQAVTRVLAVEPAAVGRKLAAKRVAQSSVPVEYAGLDGQELALPADSVDFALSTWTLCTIPDAAIALAEIRRVLRPGGVFHFAEHGRSPDAKVARWQDRLTPLQRKVAGGCHLNREIDRMIADSGLQLGPVRTYYVSGPRPSGYVFEGTATKT
jgi:ubiquinone/menaquinone biosynthesis C-methylase UbiE